MGKVERIGARATHVLTNDNILVIVQNSEFVSVRVVKWTHIDPRVRFRNHVGVGYNSDPHVVEKLLLEVADANPKVLKNPAPTVIFRNLARARSTSSYGCGRPTWRISRLPWKAS